MKKLSPILIFILLFLGMSLFPYIPILIFNINMDNFLPLVRIIYTFIMDLLYMVIVFMVYKNDIINNFKSYFRNFKDNFKLSFPYYIIGLVIMIISNNLISIIFTSASANNEEAVRSLIDSYPLYMIFSVTIYAPFIEEILFRKSIRDMFNANSKFIKYLYVIISGLVFASMHVLGMTTNITDYLYIIPYMALGCSFALIYYKTNNIFSSIVLHSMHNILAVIIYFVFGG